MSDPTHIPEPKLRILLVDDEPALRETLAVLLDFAGHEVVCARDGPDALERLEEVSVDVIITDYMMPFMDGITLVRKIRENPRSSNIPILMMSGADLPSDAEPHGGADAFLQKPAEFSQLRELLQSLALKNNT